MNFTALADRYSFDRELGAGGMATVYLADDLRHRRKVAIKVLHPELSAVIGSERFLKEIEVTANLQHPHILPLFDSGDVNGQLYYVMPFVEGETLRGRLDREQQLPIADAVRIAREVADALAYAHKRGVVHRDIKPENILLQDGHALVADFGIALAVQQAGGGRLTQTGLSLGTPQYMSPEQAMGERTIDARSDIYALGAVTYEMIAGEPPFTGPTAQAIIARAMTERPRSLTAERETLSPAIERAVMTALAKLPADRYATASAFSDALVSEGTSSGAPNLSARSLPHITRRWIPWAALAAGVALGAVAALSIRSGNRTSDVAPPRFWSIALPREAPLEIGHDMYDAFLRSIAVSPDGNSVVWTALVDDVPMLWQARNDNGTMARLPGTAGATLPTFSPDGRHIAFVIDTVIRKFDTLDGTVTRIGGTPTWIQTLAWSSADRLIANNYHECPRLISPSAGTAGFYPRRPCVRTEGDVSERHDDNVAAVSARGVIGLLDIAASTIRPLRRPGVVDTTDVAGLVEGSNPFLMGKDVVLFLHDSALYAARFDASSAQLRDAPRQVLSGVRREAIAGGAQAVLSESGTLVWVSGGDAAISHFVLVDRATGRHDTLPVPPLRVSSYALAADGQRLAYSEDLPGGESRVHVFDRRRNITDVLRMPIRAQVENWVDGDSGISVFLPAVTKGRRHVIVRTEGSVLRVDSSATEYMSSSHDGSMRCNEGVFWRTGAPSDPIRIDADASWCRFSPDGRHVSWNTSTGLYVAPVDRSAASAKRKVAPTGADEARWSADGLELTYRSGRNWYTVPAKPAADRSMTTPRLVFTGTYNQAYASWDRGPDGRLLLLQGKAPPKATHVNVITNFPRYVREKLATSR